MVYNYHMKINLYGPQTQHKITGFIMTTTKNKTYIGNNPTWNDVIITTTINRKQKLIEVITYTVTK